MIQPKGKLCLQEKKEAPNQGESKRMQWARHVVLVVFYSITFVMQNSFENLNKMQICKPRRLKSNPQIFWEETAKN